MLEKVANEANQLLSKIDDFKYFVLLGTFILMLDSTLITHSNASLLRLSWNEVDKTFTMGSALAFICFFSFYITFIVATARILIIAIVSFIPFGIINFFKSNSSAVEPRKDLKNIWELRTMAIKNNNAVAYEAFKEKQQKKDSNNKLEQYCLAFLIASIINLFSSSEEAESLIITMTSITNMNDMSPIENIKFILTCLLYLGIMKIGILDGCGFTYSYTEDNYIYLPRDNKPT